MRTIPALLSAVLAIGLALADLEPLDAKRMSSSHMSRTSAEDYGSRTLDRPQEPWVQKEDRCIECSAPVKERKMLEERLRRKRLERIGGTR